MTHNTLDCKHYDKTQNTVIWQTVASSQTTSTTSREEVIHSVQINENKYTGIEFCKTAKLTKRENVVVDGLINNKLAKILRDTSCNNVLVAKKFVKANQFTGNSD